MSATDKVRVLVVDDSPMIVELLLEALTREGDVEVVTALHPIGVSATARRFRPHVAIVDVQMPGFGGAEAVGALRRAWPAVRIILSSSIPADELRALAARLGVECISKSVGLSLIHMTALRIGRQARSAAR